MKKLYKKSKPKLSFCVRVLSFLKKHPHKRTKRTLIFFLNRSDFDFFIKMYKRALIAKPKPNTPKPRLFWQRAINK